VSALLISLIATLLLLGCVAGPVLCRVAPRDAQPGALAACWLGLLLGTLTATGGMIILALVAPPTPGHGLLEWLRDCLPHHGLVASVSGALVSLVIAGGCGVRFARGLPRLRRAARQRRDHRSMLEIVAREDHRHPDVLLLDHPLPVAYCLPSRWRPIVLSTGVGERLSSRQVEAVLAHERAHLRQRHHRMLLFLELCHALLPWLPTVRLAKAKLPVLLEMTADDAAARRWGRRTLAAALREVATAPGLAGALSASGEGEGSLSRRLGRLEDGSALAGHGHGGRALAWTAAASAATVPLVTGIGSVAAVAGIC
jgi:Zn-dependent protease with chaperone function